MNDPVIKSIFVENRTIYGLDENSDVWIRVPGQGGENAKWRFWQS